MPLVEHLATSAWHTFSELTPELSKAWPQGEQRELSGAIADRVVSMYPGCFAVVSAAAPAAPQAPEVNRAMKPPPKRKAAPKKAAPKTPTKTKATKK